MWCRLYDSLHQKNYILPSKSFSSSLWGVRRSVRARWKELNVLYELMLVPPLNESILASKGIYLCTVI